ncbi:MAG: hypothetical protein JWN70_2139, partial [Planctomycetaceae bacterium]|nr:hypothetical protein [Planctomycetaceae bacterium]
MELPRSLAFQAGVTAAQILRDKNLIEQRKSCCLMQYQAVDDNEAYDGRADKQDFASQLQVLPGDDLANHRDESHYSQLETQQALNAPMIHEEKGNRIGLDELDFLVLQHDVSHEEI